LATRLCSRSWTEFCHDAIFCFVKRETAAKKIYSTVRGVRIGTDLPRTASSQTECLLFVHEIACSPVYLVVVAVGRADGDNVAVRTNGDLTISSNDRANNGTWPAVSLRHFCAKRGCTRGVQNDQQPARRLDGLSGQQARLDHHVKLRRAVNDRQRVKLKGYVGTRRYSGCEGGLVVLHCVYVLILWEVMPSCMRHGPDMSTRELALSSFQENR